MHNIYTPYLYIYALSIYIFIYIYVHYIIRIFVHTSQHCTLSMFYVQPFIEHIL